MLMIVDFPAPFSPITPWMLPRRTVRETSLLAWFVPNHLLTLPSSRAGGRISLGRLPGDRLRKSPCTMVSLPRLSVIPPPPLVQRFRLLVTAQVALSMTDQLQAKIEKPSRYWPKYARL